MPDPFPLLFPAILIFFYPFISKRTGSFISYFNLLRFYGSNILRDAVSAYKIDDFVAREMRERIGHKPYIFIDFGAGHSSLEVFLKHKRLRNFRRKIRFPFDFLLDFSYLNLVQEIRNINTREPSSFGSKKIIRKERETFTRKLERILYDISENEES